MKLPTASDIKAYFPPQITFPVELAALCEWLGKYGYPISGDFELRAGDGNVFKHWFGTDSVSDRFGMFGAGPDGSIYAIWQCDDGKMPIVHLGSEGQNNFVLANDMLDFMRLLAIGYSEMGFDDLTVPPPPKEVNPAFRNWVTSRFLVNIPALGSAVTLPAQAWNQDFQKWVSGVLGW